MRHSIKQLITLSLVFALASCASTSSDDTPKHSGFLSDYSLLKEADMGDDSITTKYQSSKVDKSKYKKVIIEPIDYYPSAPTGKLVPQMVQDEVEGYIETMMSKTIGQKYEITDKPGADTFKLRAAITGLSVDDKELSAYQYIPISFLFSAASGSLNDMSVKLKLEAEAVDSQTGEVISAFTKLDAGETLENKDTKLSFKHIQPLLKKWFSSLDKVVNQ